jgi:hypothetical protein
MARAKVASSCATSGSCAAGRLKPWRHALRAERALPSAVFGPRLARPLTRLAWRLASLAGTVMHRCEALGDMHSADLSMLLSPSCHLTRQVSVVTTKRIHLQGKFSWREGRFIPARRKIRTTGSSESVEARLADRETHLIGSSMRRLMSGRASIIAPRRRVLLQPWGLLLTAAGISNARRLALLETDLLRYTTRLARRSFLDDYHRFPGPCL